MNERKLKPRELQKGMYVCRLDRPWQGTPFLLQGVRIEGEEEIALLEQYCEHVYIDTDKSKGDIKPAKGTVSPRPEPGDETLSDLKLTSYPVKTSLDEELVRARTYRDELLDSFNEIMGSLRLGKQVNVISLEIGLNKVKESILRNPGAFMLLRLLKEKDAYTYEHCVDVSALSIIVGRQLGLPREILDDLALGAILFDVGKTQVPLEILNKTEKLTEDEYKLVQEHVEHSVSIASGMEGINDTVLDIIANHHERYDGKGYPNGYMKNHIPILSRIVGIVDCYDAMTSVRSYSKAMRSDAAIREIYSWRNKLFQDEIVEYFIQAIGIYPAGTVVELSNGEVGIIVTQNELRRLRPKVLIVLDSAKKPVFSNRIRDLYYETVFEDKKALDIIKSVEAEKYGLNPKEYFF